MILLLGVLLMLRGARAPSDRLHEQQTRVSITGCGSVLLISHRMMKNRLVTHELGVFGGWLQAFCVEDYIDVLVDHQLPFRGTARETAAPLLES